MELLLTLPQLTVKLKYNQQGWLVTSSGSYQCYASGADYLLMLLTRNNIAFSSLIGNRLINLWNLVSHEVDHSVAQHRLDFIAREIASDSWINELDTYLAPKN